jgi:uncharacterized protein (DUF433 family)
MPTLLNTGVYDAREVTHLLGRVHVEQVIRWSVKDAKGRPAMVTPTHGRAFAFVDLVSLAVVAELVARDVPESEVRTGIEFLRKWYGFSRPLAHERVLRSVATSGRAFIARFDSAWVDVGKGGQGALDEIVGIYLRRISYDSNGVAVRWQPTPDVTVDPRIQAGTPCVLGTRVPTSAIVELLRTTSAQEIAEDYDLTIEQVQAAAEFERQLGEGLGLAA